MLWRFLPALFPPLPVAEKVADIGVRALAPAKPRTISSDGLRLRRSPELLVRVRVWNLGITDRASRAEARHLQQHGSKDPPLQGRWKALRLVAAARRVRGRRNRIYRNCAGNGVLVLQGAAAEGWHGYGAVKAGEHARLRREFHFLALANGDVGGAASDAESEAARHVAKNGADQCAAAGADGGAHDVALVVVFFLQDLALVDLDVLAGLGVAIAAAVLNGQDAHLNGDDAAIDFHAAKGEIHVRLPAKQREAARFFHGADGAVDTRAHGNQQGIANEHRLGDHGHEGVAIASAGAADIGD